MKKNRHWAYKLYPKKVIKRIENKIKLLGQSYSYDAISLLNIRFCLLLFIFLFFLIFSKHGYFLAPFFTVLFYIISEKLILDYPIKKRAKKLEKEAIFYFEILSLTIDSGRNLTSAINTTSSNVESELSLEFKKMLNEVKLGKSLVEGLNSLKERIPSDSINNIILSLIQSTTTGSSITESLNNQLEYLREKELLEIKAEIAKLPTKISIVSVIFFIPIMLLVILSPVIIEFLSK